MPEHESQPTDVDWRLTTFDGVRREQLRRWAQLPLENILQAIEEMEDFSRQLGTLPGSKGGELARDGSDQQPPGEYETSGDNHDK